MLIVAVACAEYDEPTISKITVDAPDMLYVAFEEEGTRTYLEDEKYQCWNSNDEISFFPVTYNVRYRFTGETGAKDGAFEKITTEAVTGSALNNCYGVYPYRQTTTISSSGIINFEMPAEQHYAKNSFGVGANSMVAVTSDKNANTLHFKNLCGYLKLKFYGDEITVKSIELKGNNNEKLAGAATIRAIVGDIPTVTMTNNASQSITLNCGNGVLLGEDKEHATQFWFALPVTTFENGITITVVDTEGNKFTKATSKSIAIERNLVQPMAALEVVMAAAPAKPANNEIWYTTSDGNKLNLNADRFGATITSHEQRDGKWVLSFNSNLSMVGVDGSLNGAFESQKTLTSIELPDGITKICAFSFYKCSALESIVLPANLQTIGAQSFVTAKLTTINIPASVTSIEYKAFEQSSLTSVNVFATTPPSLTDQNVFPRYIVVYVPEESIKAYERHAYWSYFPIKALPDELLGGGGSEGGNEGGSEGGNEGGSEGGNEGGSEGGNEGGSEGGNEGGNEGGDEGGDDPEIDDPVVTPTTGSEIRYTTSDGNSVTLRAECFNVPVTSHEKQGNEWVITFNGTLTEIGIEGSSTGTFENSNTLTSITIPDSVTKMYSYTFYECSNLQSVELSDNIELIGEMSFYRCTSLTEITLPASVNTIGGGLFFDCSALSTVDCYATTPPTLGDNQVFPAGVTIYVPDSATGAYLQNNMWNKYTIKSLSGEVTDEELMYAPNDPNYNSSDYSANGKYVALQTATEGNGIDIVLMGDGYSDRQIASGRYEADMRKAMEAFFSKEPYTSFRHLFNVYMVTLVSKREGCSNDYAYGETALNCKVKSDGVSVDADTGDVYSYSREVLGEQSYTNNDGPRIDESTMIVIMNSTVYAGVCKMSSPKYNTTKDYGNGPALSFFPLCGDDKLFANLLIHEACGHGFGKLADEYYSSGNGAINNRGYYEIKDFEQWGWFKNVDATIGEALTAQTIKWKHFLNDPRYAGVVGIYEGAYSYAQNAYRPANDSIMQHVRGSDGEFNAPSREAIYYRIHKLAYGDSWSYSFEEFATWDAKNR